MKVEIYSDVACPWCYVGKRRFERALAAFSGAGRVEVVYRPYQLDPEASDIASPLRDRLAEKFGAEALDGMNARLVEAGASEGVDFDLERALSVNTLTAHRLLEFALREYGPKRQAAVKDRLLRAYFTEGVDVSDTAALTALAAGEGLDPARVAAFLASGEGVAELRAEFAQARRIGVTAVPTFVFEGRWAVQGAQEASTFLRVLEEVAAQTPDGNGRAAADGPGGEACADGACPV